MQIVYEKIAEIIGQAGMVAFVMALCTKFVHMIISAFTKGDIDV